MAVGVAQWLEELGVAQWLYILSTKCEPGRSKVQAQRRLFNNK
jgi:hypothetical protein